MSHTFCDPQETAIWFPVTPGAVILPTADPVATDPSPLPPNAVQAPSGFDPDNPDLCELFEEILPVDVAPVYSSTQDAGVVATPYGLNLNIIALVRTFLAVQAVDYPMEQEAREVTFVVRPRLVLSTYIFKIEPEDAAEVLVEDNGAGAQFSHIRRLRAYRTTFVVGQPEVGFPVKISIPSTSFQLSALVPENVGPPGLRLLPAESGNFALSGQDVQLFWPGIAGLQGTFALVGTPASFVVQKLSGLGPVVGTVAPLLGTTAATDYTGWTLLFSGNDDEGFTQTATWPFTFTLNSIGYTSCFVNYNSFVTFGSGQSIFSGLSASVPALPKIHLGAGDASCFKIYTKIGSDSARIRYEGCFPYNAGSSNTFVELAFFPPTAAGDQFVEVRVGSHAKTSGPFMIANTTTSYASSAITQNSSWVFAGNSSGTTWTLTSDRYVSNVPSTFFLLPADQGALSLSGSSANFAPIILGCEQGIFTLTGQGANFVPMRLDSGSFVASGSSATLSIVDPNFSNVSLLLHMDGANDSTVFTDNSSNNITVTRAGDAKISTTQSKFGGSSGYFDGTGDQLSTATQTVFGLGTADYTIECWLYCAFSNSNNGYFTIFQVANGSVVSQLRFGDSGFGHRLQFSCGSSLSDVFGVTLTKNNFTNTWKHVAVVRSSGVMTIYVDGTAATRSTGGPETGTTVTHNLGTSSILYLAYNSVSAFFNGYIDDFRITKGVARYTANFTAPIRPYPDT